MRTRTKVLLAGLAAGGFALPAPAGAANCHTVSCLNKEVKTLTKVVAVDTKFLSMLANCMREVPVSQYGDGTNHTFGYVYNPGGTASPYNTTALDVTNSGDRVSAWFMYDKCNRTGMARDHAAADTEFGPIADFTLPADFRSQAKVRP